MAWKWRRVVGMKRGESTKLGRYLTYLPTNLPVVEKGF
jgi:hypothetical protein